ncbi:Uncharacterised protein [Staphylococcus aureus]|nr:Uncharacterised protein [Staphylococcus aureus]CAC6581916.1 Uncharacterised protein [Staphylococcus aureus]CDP39901.1 Phage protein [Staphylococcus aureus]CDP39990.1 hypothetical protein BN966_8360 [Staphylococcus aureus]SAN42139.1 Uncharacterised protein [Staphylococcus aureus]
MYTLVTAVVIAFKIAFHTTEATVFNTFQTVTINVFIAFQAFIIKFLNPSFLFHNKTNIAINAAITPITIVIGPPKIPNTVTSPVIAFLINPILPNNNWNITDIIFNGPFNNMNAPFKIVNPALNKPNLLTNAMILPINPPPIKLDTARIIGIKNLNAPTKVIMTPTNCAVAGCASNKLAIQPVIATATRNTALAIGAIAVANATNPLAMFPINCIISGPLVCI